MVWLMAIPLANSRYFGWRQLGWLSRIVLHLAYNAADTAVWQRGKTMKQYIWTLVSLWLIVGLAACTPTYEPAYEQAWLASTTDTASTLSAGVPTPTLKFVIPTIVSTATPLPIPTFPPASSPTAVPTIVPAATETPTTTPTAVPPTTQATQAVTVTLPVTNVLPIAQTPTPGWYYYISDSHGVLFQYPAHWWSSLDFAYRLEGSDGFVELLATNSQDNLLVNACHDAAMGTAVPIEWLTAAGQEACLIQTDDGSRAILIVRFPELRENLVPGVAYTFLVLQADPAHMSGFVQTLTFFTPAVFPSPVP